MRVNIFGRGTARHRTGPEMQHVSPKSKEFRSIRASIRQDLHERPDTRTMDLTALEQRLVDYLMDAQKGFTRKD